MGKHSISEKNYTELKDVGRPQEQLTHLRHRGGIGLGGKDLERRRKKKKEDATELEPGRFTNGLHSARKAFAEATAGLKGISRERQRPRGK